MTASGAAVPPDRATARARPERMGDPFGKRN